MCEKCNRETAEDGDEIAGENERLPYLKKEPKDFEWRSRVRHGTHD